MIKMQRHAYQPVFPLPSVQSLVSACSCGWRGTTTAEPDADPDPGFDDWLSSHYEPFLQQGGLRGIVSYDAISRLTTAFARSQHIHWTSSDRRIISLSWGWYCIINRTAQAVLALGSVDQCREAVPLVRSVFEHSLFLQALIRHGESAFDAAVREQMRQRNNLIQTGQGIPGFDSLRIEQEQVLPDPIPDAAWTQQVVTICRRFGVESRLYLIYRTLCAYTHPTIAAARNFVSEPDDMDLGLRLEPNSNLDSDLLFWTAVMMVWAGQIFNTILSQPIISEELQLAAQELGVVPIDELSSSSQFGAMDLTKDRLNQIMFGLRSGNIGQPDRTPVSLPSLPRVQLRDNHHGCDDMRAATLRTIRRV
jgi:hypothetical protein